MASKSWMVELRLEKIGLKFTKNYMNKEKYFVVYSEHFGEWKVCSELPADTAGRGYVEFSDFGRAELEAALRNQKKWYFD